MRLTIWRWRLVWMALLAVGIAWAVRPLGADEGPENWFPNADKVHHLWFFALLFWTGQRWAAWRPAWALALGLLSYGLAMEFVQGLTPSRSASLTDVAADGLGIAIGWWISQRSNREPTENRG